MYQVGARLATGVVAVMLPAVTSVAGGCSATSQGTGTNRTTAIATAEPAAKRAASLPERGRKAPAAAVPAEQPGTDAVEQLAARIERSAQEALGDSVVGDREWKPIDVIGWSGRPRARALALTFTSRQAQTPIAVYYLVAWQPLFAPSGEPGETPLSPPLLTVTEQAMVFAFPPASADEGSVPGPALHAAVSDALKLDWNQRDITDVGGWMQPKELRIISLKVHPHHALVEAALPGSGLPHPGNVAKAFPHRMVRLSLVPDRGRVIRQWIAPEQESKRRPGACPCRDMQ